MSNPANDFEIGTLVRLAHARTPGGYAATIGALARITGPAFDLPSGRRVQSLIWLQPTSANGQKDGAYCVVDFAEYAPGPTSDELAALRNYAIEHGPLWKSELALDWYNARTRSCDSMPNRGAILQGLRNSRGPSWLDDFKFESPIAWPNMRRCSANELGNCLAALSLHPWNNTEAETVRLWAARRERRRRASR
jgi:hypothetical protein